MRRAISTLALGLIIAICAGLLVIGIAQVRATAAQIQCRNNLRQLGLALMNYGETHKKFPAAGLQNAGLPPEKRLSWIVAITPFVKSNNYYNKMNKEKSWDAEENRFAALMRMPVLQCPGHQTRRLAETFFATDYVGVAGIGANAAEVLEGDERAGFFGYERLLSFEAVSRRGPNLLAIAETSFATGPWTAAGLPTVRGLDNASPYLGREAQFGGIHKAGMNVALADASVRFVKESIDPSVFEALAQIKNGENSIRWEDD
jgi:hypothetical protein